MKIQQIAVFLQNKPGHLGDVCKTLKDNGINIVTLSLADTQQFGILRLIVKDWETAAKKLEEAGYLVQMREVVAVEVKDEPGGMFDVLDALGKGGVNVEYVYAFTFHKKANSAVLVFRFDDLDKALGVLQTAGVNVLSKIDLF
ncbi:MAG: amino acid-binding protein [Kiritimatiellaeota bacterium]|nr:amino acid-binding protein [Kiritimatiellota bacterium]